jgi:uncharacterized Fe-S cluster-containing radical SAM superfamily protein
MSRESFGRLNNIKIPIAKIGSFQKIDIEKSSGIVFYDDIARICTVVKRYSVHDYRGDKSPCRMAELFGGNWRDYNNHFIVQSAGCPLRCSYCYIDNLKPDLYLTAEELVDKFIAFKENTEPKFGIKLKVFHFMGGAPAAYCNFWPELRNSLNRKGLENTVLFSDVIFVENYFFRNKPWEFLNLPRFIVSGCLKGTNRKNFIANTGYDLFEQSLKELQHYLSVENFYLTLIAFDKRGLDRLYRIIPRGKIDFLNVVNYEATKVRRMHRRSMLREIR